MTNQNQTDDEIGPQFQAEKQILDSYEKSSKKFFNRTICGLLLWGGLTIGFPMVYNSIHIEQKNNPEVIKYRQALSARNELLQQRLSIPPLPHTPITLQRGELYPYLTNIYAYRMEAANSVKKANKSLDQAVEVIDQDIFNREKDLFVKAQIKRDQSIPGFLTGSLIGYLGFFVGSIITGFYFNTKAKRKRDEALNALKPNERSTVRDYD